MNGKVLIIDDDAELTAVLTKRLQQAGLEVHSASDGVSGIKQVRLLKPSLIILDLVFPAGGGLFILENLKRAEETRRIPVLVLTGTPDAELKKKLLAFGMISYLQKPYSAEEMLAEVQKSLASAKAQP